MGVMGSSLFAVITHKMVRRITPRCQQSMMSPPQHPCPLMAMATPSHGHGNTEEKENLLPPVSLPDETPSVATSSPDRGPSSSPLKPSMTTNTPTKRQSPACPMTSSGFREAKRARHQLKGAEVLLIGAGLARADPTDTRPALSDTKAREYVKSCRQIMRKPQDDEDEVRRRS